MPFTSIAQRAFMYSRHPAIAKRWEKHTPKGKKLPKHAHHSDPPGDSSSPRILRMLTKFGPPNEWSGGVAAMLSPEDRKLLKAAWAGLGADARASIEQKFSQNFDKTFGKMDEGVSRSPVTPSTAGERERTGKAAATPSSLPDELRAKAKEADALLGEEEEPMSDEQMVDDIFSVIREKVPARYSDAALRAAIMEAMERWDVHDPAHFVAVIEGPRMVAFREMLINHMTQESR